MLSDDLPESPEPASDAPPLTIEQAIANLRHDDLSLRYYAAWWLGKFRVRDSEAIDALILALRDEADRTQLGGYPLRRNAARALGKLGDRKAVPSLIYSLDCDDFYVREAAARSLGALGDRSAVPALLKLLAGGVEAAQLVPDRPHLAQPVEAAMEALEGLGATEAIPLIQPFLKHLVDRVQYAACRAMYVLTQEPVYGDRLVQALAHPDLKLRRTALMSVGASGYLPAVDSIAQAAVENSFKLVALKSLLESQLKASESLTPATENIMTLMDTLL